jgi:hypothetical protein
VLLVKATMRLMFCLIDSQQQYQPQLTRVRVTIDKNSVRYKKRLREVLRAQRDGGAWSLSNWSVLQGLSIGLPASARSELCM